MYRFSNIKEVLLPAWPDSLPLFRTGGACIASRNPVRYPATGRSDLVTVVYIGTVATACPQQAAREGCAACRAVCGCRRRNQDTGEAQWPASMTMRCPSFGCGTGQCAAKRAVANNCISAVASMSLRYRLPWRLDLWRCRLPATPTVRCRPGQMHDSVLCPPGWHRLL